MSMDLDRVLEKVSCKSTFIEFLAALSEDWEDDRRKEKESPSPQFSTSVNGWENGSIGAFLEAASAWAVASDGEVKSDNIWQEAARIIYAGKYYE